METLSGPHKRYTLAGTLGSGSERETEGGREEEEEEERASFLFGSALKIHDVEDAIRRPAGRATLAPRATRPR